MPLPVHLLRAQRLRVQRLRALRRRPADLRGVSTRLTSLVAATALAASAVLAGGALTAPAQAAGRATPGDFTGYGFDQCATPSQSAMDAWLTASPFWAVGVYIAGDNRACGDAVQTHLTATWVDAQLRNGWRILPITVGPQASCYDNPNKKIRISPDPTDTYAKAREQAKTEARETVRRARALGIVAGSTLWYDLEHFDTSREHCRESALHFLSAWTKKLHDLDYVSGVYSGASSGIAMLDEADAYRPGRFAMPDYLWIARWNGQATVEILDDEGNPEYLRPTAWMPHRRVHQYLGDHEETHGGVRITIDSNYLSVGRGTRAGKAPHFCGVEVDFPTYRRLGLGKRHVQVKAAKCLLRMNRLYDGRMNKLYNKRTVRAVLRFQEAHHLRRTGKLNSKTWTVLLAEGSSPVVKVGSGGRAVRRVQRSMNAVSGAGLAVTGIFDDATTQAVRAYQASRDLPRTGVVADDTWADLQRGRR